MPAGSLPTIAAGRWGHDSHDIAGLELSVIAGREFLDLAIATANQGATWLTGSTASESLRSMRAMRR